ncbi:hypothetical protein [Amycolatopsis pigmentata]|uniref:Uncharacterized protein n=1 Tax=Amycolatopsis pigmentata TaxID=450801 RepID=A0ABW5G3Q5_9PSEU
MPDLTLECLIDGQRYSAEQLERLEYDRHVHVLREMKRLGAEIRHNGNTLSDDDINLLSPEDAREVSIATRRSYDFDGIRGLFKAQLQASDQLWKDANDAPAGAPIRIARADLTITGVPFDKFRQGSDFDALRQTYPALHPDHYFAYVDGGGRLLVMETFGMYGGPTEVHTVPDLDVAAPVERDAGYPVLTAGYARLASDDGTDINAVAFHQFKPLDQGVSVKLCAAFPPNMPQVIVDGHKVHMAIEFWESAKLAAR